RAGLFDADGKPGGPVYRSLRLNFVRIRGGQGRPLEVLDSIRGLNDAVEAYAAALTDHERARFRLLTALGVSAARILNPAQMPCPPEASSAEAGGKRQEARGEGDASLSSLASVPLPLASPMASV